jgi:fermentation-respiration switch protein FrsA (DUF1100 family)
MPDSGLMLQHIWSAVVWVVKGYLMAVFVILIFQRHIMYYPAKAWAVQPEEVGAQTVSYTASDGIRLTSWYAPPKEGKPVFMMFHGNAGNISHRAFKMAYFAERGYGFLLAECRGYGGNAGKPTEQGLYSDARAAMNWLMKEQKVPENKIIVYGESIGSGPASQMALEYRSIKALVLEAPFTSAESIAGDVYPWLKPFIFMTLDKYDNLSKTPHFAMPVIILHGTEDEVIPARHGKALFAAVASPVKKYVSLEGGGHQNLGDFELFPHIEDFIAGLN